ncbi:MAG: copper resistance protein NlpE [Treponema sp.]|nr:copper resistance protein NlpE [Treponema sp.]
MRKSKLACIAFMAIPLALGCAHANRYAPSPDVAIETYHNSRNSLTWWGVYEGTIPSASGSGINVRITLNRDYTFEISYEYLGRDNGLFAANGTFRWDDAGRTITLENRADSPFRYSPRYQVGEMFLRQLDIHGNPIEGDHYVLQKVSR